jgi:hypothetical protein
MLNEGERWSFAAKMTALPLVEGAVVLGHETPLFAKLTRREYQYSSICRNDGTREASLRIFSQRRDWSSPSTGQRSDAA